MTRPRRLLLGLVAAVGFTALGAAGAVVALRMGDGPPGRPSDTVAAPPRGDVAAAAPLPSPEARAVDAEVEIVLSPEVVARAGFKTAEVTADRKAAGPVVPGTVMPNAYREVKVTPIAAGLVTKVHVELGAAVRRGMPLATLFSPDLADAQTRYLSMTAGLEADRKKLERTQKLVAIGAASQQELEEVTAVHDSRATEVAAARQRLLLLGLAPDQVEALKIPSQVVSTVIVPAPIDGVVTARSANLGQVIGMGQELFVVTDLSEIWAIGDLYEQDFRAVRVGSETSVTTAAYPGVTMRGRVAYIDPRVDPQARTAKVRVGLPNLDGRLKLGMFVNMTFSAPGGERAVLVPKAAVQTVGDRQVVFVPAKGEDAKFIQRTVRLGPLVGEHYVVLSGLSPGDVVVTEGSFLLRAESARNAPSG
jgi:cobalt-zinc-cadmium efflux system membrane fusion protein